MGIPLSRRGRRAGSRRARQRSSREKAEQYFELLDTGASRSTIAAKLGLPAAGVDELLEISRKERERASKV